MSITSISLSSTFELRTRRTRLNPSCFVGVSRHAKISVASTRLAPRRSASKEKNPSADPMSRTVFPARLAGMYRPGSFCGLRSCPGVTMPLPRSIVWNHLILPTSCASSVLFILDRSHHCQRRARRVETGGRLPPESDVFEEFVELELPRSIGAGILPDRRIGRAHL